MVMKKIPLDPDVRVCFSCTTRLSQLAEINRLKEQVNMLQHRIDVLKGELSDLRGG